MQLHIHAGMKVNRVSKRNPVVLCSLDISISNRWDPFTNRVKFKYSILDFLYFFLCRHTLLPIVWNRPSNVSALLCLNGAKFFKQHMSIPIIKHRENMFIFTNMLSVCLKFGVDIEIVLKNWHRINTTKRTHCWVITYNFCEQCTKMVSGRPCIPNIHC